MSQTPTTGLARLLDIDPARFAAEHWGQAPRHILGADRAPAGGVDQGQDLEQGDDLQDLLDLESIDDLLTVRGLRTPFLRVARDGVTRPDADFTRGGGVGAGVGDQLDDTALTRLFAQGSTIVLQGLHRTHPPLLELAQDLAADLGHPVQVNAYVTPAQTTGFSAHYDVHDVFVLQTAGEKSWRIHAPVQPHPLRDQPWAERRDEVAARAEEAPHLDITMSPGDVLYLPRGWLHAATARGETSAHITVGVHTWHRGHLADSLIAAVRARLADDPAQRASLPLGVDLGDPAALREDLEAVREAITLALGEVEGESVAQDMVTRQDRSQPPGPARPVATAAALASWQESTELRLRPHVRARVTTDPDGSALVTGRAGRIRVGRAEAAQVVHLVEQGRSTVGELGAGLSRDLVEAGLVVVDTSGASTASAGG